MTLMIGFWGAPVHEACARSPYDACGPMPRAQPKAKKASGATLTLIRALTLTLAKAEKARAACAWPSMIRL